MKYSVIVTVYNDEKYLQDCFNSIQSQTIKPEEIIIVDDNSTDNTGKIIDQYPFRKIFSSEPKHKERWLNRVRAFKLGLDSIKNPIDLILKVDADIIIPENYTETLFEHFINNKNLAACSGIQNPNQFHPLPRNGAIIYRLNTLVNDGEIREVYAWDRWTILWLMERGYDVYVDESIQYKEQRDSILTLLEAKRSGMVRRQEHYPLRGVLIQALLQRGIKSLYFIYGYLAGSGSERHDTGFIREYSRKEEKERMKYIQRRLGVRQ